MLMGVLCGDLELTVLGEEKKRESLSKIGSRRLRPGRGREGEGTMTGEW